MHEFASIVLVAPRGWVLLQERDEYAFLAPEHWGFVGGHVEPGEDAETAAYRELAEETGIELRPPALTPIGTYPVCHPEYGTDDRLHLYAAATDLTDADIVVGEGRQIVFLAPDQVQELPLTTSAASVLPQFLASEHYRMLAGRTSGIQSGR